MDISIPQKFLGDYNVDALIEAVLAQPEEAWFEQEHRQKQYDVHKDTSSIVLIFSDEEWPNVSTSRDAGWERLNKSVMPLVKKILEEHYPADGRILRAIAARLHPGGKIMPHVDRLPSFHAGHRIHIPIVTNAACRFLIDGRPYKFEVGKAYEINNQMLHSVQNSGNENRIHIIFDYMPPDGH